MRLDKALTLAGITRSQARKAVSQGRALVNGVVVRDISADVEPSQVTFDGKPLADTGDITLMLYKPAGVLTATTDRSAPTVLDYVPADMKNRGLGPVGRLDKDVTGLVLLTTDGQLAHRLISPKREVAKVYIAKVEGEMDEESLDIIRKGGIEFTDFVSKPAGAEYLGDCRVKLTLTEGKYDIDYPHNINKTYIDIDDLLKTFLKQKHSISTYTK
jgi:16S rRNA pseudouridine516 synthase